ncbi:hypothetical protein IFM89_002688 [Coptis chinensis]|uniref:Ribosome-recycling factor, chloroplastic n=1 Tax=Coptis chinensis TaxID=261450 RepID=A0A835M4G9_9MAGN|nr:hypothetical protein IFM89_002688 [Coptis chinensis]
MEKTIESVRENFNAVRTGRASPSMLDRVEVEYYGTPVSLKSIAQISSPDASSLLIQPYDKSSLKSIEKAIVSSDRSLNPNNDGEVIRLSVPQLTSDRRKELSKVVAKQAEEGKVESGAQPFFRLNVGILLLGPNHVGILLLSPNRLCAWESGMDNQAIAAAWVAIRNIRRDAIKSYEKLEKEKKLSEDIVKDLSGDLQKMTDEYMKKIDSIFKQKEKELLKV